MLQLDPDLTETLCASMPDLGVSSTSCTLINNYVKKFQRDQNYHNSLFLEELSCRKLFLERKRLREQRMFDELTLVHVDGSDQVHEQLLKRRCTQLNDISREIILIESLIGKYTTELEFDDSVDLSTPISYDTFPRRASSLGSTMPSSGGFGALGVNRNDSMGSAKDVPLGGSSSSSRLGRIFNHRSGSGRSRFRRSDQDMAGTEHSNGGAYQPNANASKKKFSLASNRDFKPPMPLSNDFDSKLLVYEKKNFFVHPNLKKKDRDLGGTPAYPPTTRLERKGSTGSFGSIRELETDVIGGAFQPGYIRSLERHLGKTNGVYMPSPTENMESSPNPHTQRIERVRKVEKPDDKHREQVSRVSVEFSRPELRKTQKQLDTKVHFEATIQKRPSVESRVAASKFYVREHVVSQQDRGQLPQRDTL